MQPRIATLVHYVSYGSPGGEFPKECRAAVVTTVGPYFSDGVHASGHIVGLAVLNPSGLFFDDDIEHALASEQAGGTWHPLETCTR